MSHCASIVIHCHSDILIAFEGCAKHRPLHKETSLLVSESYVNLGGYTYKFSEQLDMICIEQNNSNRFIMGPVRSSVTGSLSDLHYLHTFPLTEFSLAQ